MMIVFLDGWDRFGFFCILVLFGQLDTNDRVMNNISPYGMKWQNMKL